MPDWDYAVKGYAGAKHQRGAPFGTLLVETTHKGEASCEIEVSAWQARIKRGEVSRVEILHLVPPYYRDEVTSAEEPYRCRKA